MWFKWLTRPKSNETEQTQAVQMWEVRWRSRNGEFSCDTQPELEAFTSWDAAEEFATALRNAYALVRTTSGTTVTVTKAK